MISKEKMILKAISEMCKNSGDVETGDHFKGVLVPYDLYELSKKPCICIGKYYDTERFFRSDDMRFYFSVKDGWGETDGYLAALTTEFVLKFTAPTDFNDLKEFAESTLPANSTHGAIAQKAKRIAAKKVIESVKNCSKRETEKEGEQPKCQEQMNQFYWDTVHTQNTLERYDYAADITLTQRRNSQT